MAAQLAVVYIRVQPNQVFLVVLCTLICYNETEEDEEESYLLTHRAGISALFRLFSYYFASANIFLCRSLLHSCQMLKYLTSEIRYQQSYILCFVSN